MIQIQVIQNDLNLPVIHSVMQMQTIHTKFHCRNALSSWITKVWIGVEYFLATVC